jgi:hypothetical protein
MDLISNSTRKADLLASANESLAAVEVILTKGEDGSGDVFDQLAYKEDSANVNVESRGPIMDAAIKMTNLGENEIVAAGSDLGLTINPR